MEANCRSDSAVRLLGVMVVLLEAKRTDSGYLKKLRELTYGNLGRHLQALDNASYVELDKVFISRNPEGEPPRV